MQFTVSEDQPQEKTEGSETPGEFTYLAIDRIIVLQQIRKFIDTACDSFLSLMESIRERGVLEPLIVAPGAGPRHLPAHRR